MHPYVEQVIWAEEKGPFSEVVDGCLKRTPAGIQALRDELKFYTERN